VREGDPEDAASVGGVAGEGDGRLLLRELDDQEEAAQLLVAEPEVEEAAFFVRSFDPVTGLISLSDRSQEPLAPASLRVSARDGAFLCLVKRSLIASGLLARFGHAAQAQLLGAVEESGGQVRLRLADRMLALPEL